MPAGSYDAIYVMGHLNVKGSPGAAALLPRGRTPPKLAICNGCASEQLAMELHEAGVRHVVCWDAEVPDVVAATFGRELLMRLAKVDGSIGKFQIEEAFKAAIDRVPWQACAAVSAGGPEPEVIEVDDSYDDPSTAMGEPASAQCATVAAEDMESLAASLKVRQQHDDEALARALQEEYDEAQAPDAHDSETVARALQQQSDEAVARALQQASDDEQALPMTPQDHTCGLAADSFDLVSRVVQGASCFPAAARWKRAAEGMFGIGEAFKRARLAT